MRTVASSEKPPPPAPVRCVSEQGFSLHAELNIDIEQCPQCGGALKLIAAILDPTVIAKILAHLGLPIRAPPRSPARSFDLFQMA
jgi:hypothetical protein